MRPVLALLLAIPAAAPAQNATSQQARGDHVALSVADVDVSADYYKRVFALPELVSPVKGPRWFDLGNGMALHLFPGRTLPVTEDRRLHLALTVPDLDAFATRLTAAKIAFFDFAGRPATIQNVRGDGVRQIFVRDPDGYWIEVNDAKRRRQG
jgi:lactoylglutathione lyase